MWTYVYADELYHHGVKGQKWGVRRYQNPDGTLTEAGKKRQEKLTASNKQSTIVKGTKMYRISDSDKSDISSDKIYVSATKESGDFYLDKLGSNKLYEKGKVYVHEYITKKDLKLPDKKTMEKIELGLLNDPKVQKELIDSLMKKGLSREQATEEVKPYRLGKAFCQKTMTVIGSTAAGAYMGLYGGVITTMANPVGMGVGAGIGSLAGAAAGMITTESDERRRALNVARVSYGDKNNKTINYTLQNTLNKQGYNAMKDYNDRRAYGTKGEQAIIVYDSKNNLKDSKISKVNSKDYGQAYARNYLKEHPESKLDFDDLVKDGEARYKNLYESGAIKRVRDAENKKILEELRKNT